LQSSSEDFLLLARTFSAGRGKRSLQALSVNQAWGFNLNRWQGVRGEYWVLAQSVLLLRFMALPVYTPPQVTLSPPVLYGVWAVALLFGLFALLLIAKGLLELGDSLTPLPHPRDDGQLVRSGVYRFVRHSLYSGLIVAGFSWALYQVSLSHLVGTTRLFAFFNLQGKPRRKLVIAKIP